MEWTQRLEKKVVSPPIALLSGYAIVAAGALILTTGQSGSEGFPSSTFFQWGPPVSVMGIEVKDQLTFYGFLIFFFLQQLSNSWISEVVYPYILNEIQDRSKKKIRYRRFALLIAALFNFYSQLTTLFLINAFSNQISFFISYTLATLICTTAINYSYIRKKEEEEDLEAYMDINN